MHTRDGHAGRDVMRSARSGRAGKGAWRALCPAYVCKRDEGGCAECAEARVRGAGRGQSGATHPGSAEGPPLSSRSGSWLPAPDSRLPVPSSRLPACLLQRARTGAKPGRRRQRHPCSCRPAAASEERGAGRGLGRAGAADGSCAAVRARSQEPAARSLALARPPPAPSLI